MAKWTGDGILRKNKAYQTVETRNVEDLLVFGYACKIFRDDEKAIYIDHGKNLISWNMDKTLKIDRYDVRAALPDLRQFEPPPGGYINRLDYLSPDEQRAEQLCEEERYYSLYHNEEEEKMYKEEELKRLHQAGSSSYGQVGFDYNKPDPTNNKNSEQDEKSDEPDEVFVPPTTLDIPEAIALPETMKLHAIIEKTAKFISGQGPQMEILIKAKQSNNPQFEFLNQNNRLNPYYKFILAAFKNGTYRTEEEIKESTMKSKTSELVQNSDDNHLKSAQHAMAFVQPPVPVPIIKYKPSANCAYTQLISKIKGVPLPPEQPPPEDNKDNNKPETTPPLVDYRLYYSSYGHNNLEKNDTQNNDTQNSNGNGNNSEKKEVEVKKISSGLMLAQCYASDTEDEADTSEVEAANSTPVLDFPIPPDYLQNIIDKTAAYVAKNGKQFEDILKTKQDSRFIFLDPINEYHSYYMYKVTGVVHPPHSTSNGTDENNDDKPKIMTPVCFSIKPKEENAVAIKPALPQEASDEDEIDVKINVTTTTTITTTTSPNIQNVNKIVIPESVQMSIQSMEPPLIVRGLSVLSHVPITTGIANNNNILNHRTKFDIDNTGAIVKPSTVCPIIPVVSPDAMHQKELKRAEEKVKDRLAQIAREKLGLISKEKQLQLERKKKAMAFLHQIKSTGANMPTTTIAKTEISTKVGTEDENDSISDASSIHSIPMSSIDDKSDHGGESSQSIDNRDNEEVTDRKSRSRSRSKSETKSTSHRRKKKSKHHSKKKSKKRSRSKSRSHSQSLSPTRLERKHRKRSSSRKLKKRRRDD